MTLRYVSAENRDTDDFDVKFSKKEGEAVYDAVTIHGPWATMTQESFRKHGRGRLGVGQGQKYVRQSNGQLHKAEG